MALSADEVGDRYPIHWLVWNDQHEELENAIYSKKFTAEDIEKKDPRGRTPLLLAVTLGYINTVKVLLDSGADVNCEKDGWTAVQEATATGDMDLLALVLSRRDHQRYLFRSRGIPDLLNRLSLAPDFYVEMKWQFTSWMPLISRICPSDTYKVYKRGANVRVDTTLIGFENRNWLRGDISYVFKGQGTAAKFMEVNHETGTVTTEVIDGTDLWPNPVPKAKALRRRLEEPLAINYLDTDKISFERNKSGIWGWRQDKTEEVNGYECKVFSANNVEIVSKTRCEHLPAGAKRTPRPPPIAGLLGLDDPKEDLELLKSEEQLKPLVTVQQTDPALKEKADKAAIEAAIAQISTQTLPLEVSSGHVQKLGGNSSGLPPETVWTFRRPKSFKNKTAAKKLAGIHVDYSSDESSTDEDDIGRCVYEPEIREKERMREQRTQQREHLQQQQRLQQPLTEQKQEQLRLQRLQKLQMQQQRLQQIRLQQWHDRETKQEEDSSDEEEAQASAASAPAPVTWQEYFSGEPMAADIGRPKDMTTKVQKFKATLSLCEDYPLELQEQIMPILDLMTAIASPHFAKLKDFIQMQLPSGFPVKIEIPLFHIMNARITFGNIFSTETPVPLVECIQEGDRLSCIIDDQCFNIGRGYKDAGSDDKLNSEDGEEGLLQYAIQQSLMEPGTHEDQVDVWEALRGARPASPSPQDLLAREERQLQRAIEASLALLSHNETPVVPDVGIVGVGVGVGVGDAELQAALALSVEEQSAIDEQLAAEQRALDEALRLSLLDK